jgi:hypothetical protein
MRKWYTKGDEGDPPMPKPRIDARAIVEKAKRRKAEPRRNVTLRVNGTIYREFQSYCKSQDVSIAELFEDYMCSILRKPSIRQQ